MRECGQRRVATLRFDVQLLAARKREMKAAALTLLLVLPVGCGPPGAGGVPVGRDATRQPQFVGKAWLSTDADASPGTLRIFLPDGTLLMDSCGETYRIARWRALDEHRLEWTEDTARIEARDHGAYRRRAPAAAAARGRRQGRSVSFGEGALSVPGPAALAVPTEFVQSQ